MSNPTEQQNALSRNVSSEAFAETAYASKEAVVYDSVRLTTPAARYIHEFERDLLLRVVHRVSTTSKLLEVGCGTGRLLTEVAERGYRVHGVDASGPMLEQLKAKLPSLTYPIELVIASATAIPYPSDCYDLVYSIRVLNQTESPDYALEVVAEMLRLTRPGGFTLVEFVNDYRPRWGSARKSKRTTRLRPSQVARRGIREGANVLTYHGAFFLSMQAYHACPTPFLPLLRVADRALSWLFPRLCSRCYVLFKK